MKYPLFLAMSFLSPSRTNKGFTLIELMIVISIIAILSVGTYVPYNYYSQLSRVRLSTEIIRQSVNDAKILSMNGYVFPGTSSNANIGLVIRKNAKEIDFLAFQSGSMSFTETPTARKIKSIPLENQIEFSDMPADAVLAYFTAPTGDIRFYRENGAELSASGIALTIGLRWAKTGALSKTLTITK